MRSATDCACAQRPSCSAMAITAFESFSSAFALYWMMELFFTNSSTERGLAKRAVPPVGSVWFGPAT